MAQDILIPAHRRGGTTFIHTCKSPAQIPARARGANDDPLCTGPRHTIFILIRALHKTIRNSRERRPLNNPLSRRERVRASPVSGHTLDSGLEPE